MKLINKAGVIELKLQVFLVLDLKAGRDNQKLFLGANGHWHVPYKAEDWRSSLLHETIDKYHK